MPKGETPLAPAIPIAWVFSLATVVIIAALAAVIFWLFGGVTSPIQYPIMIALLCFALSTVACLLFASNAKIEATLPVAAITMGGPAVIWIGTLVLFAQVFPPPPPQVTPESFIHVLRAQEMRGWNAFDTWPKELGGRVGAIVFSQQSNQVRQALDATYYLGGKSRQKMVSPVVEELFVYLNDQTIEFQRVRTTSDVAEVYFKSYTMQSGPAPSVILAKTKGNSIIANELSGGEEWRRTSGDPVDCLIITVYPGGMFDWGDILYFAINKYRKDGMATLSTGILAPEPIAEPSTWLLRGFPFPTAEEIPVVFKARTDRWQTDVRPIVAQLSEWFALLDRKPAGLRPEVAQFLEGVRAKLPSQSFSDFHTSPMFKAAYSARLDKLEDAVAIAFERK